MLSAARVGVLKQLVGPRNVITNRQQLARLSRDYSWFSPLLDEPMRQHVAEVAVAPDTVAQLADVLGHAYEWRYPVTVRGGGTGNYGQAVPMSGGLLLLTHRLNRLIGVTDESVTAEAGARLGDLSKMLSSRGRDLRIFPSTYLTSSAGGFVAGGTGGIGSITWGTLHDGNVIAASVMDMHETPTIRVVNGDLLGTLIHTYGTVSIITDLTFATEPRLPWSEAVYSFPDLRHASEFAQACSEVDTPKRLLSVHEWPIPSYFSALSRVGAIQHQRACVLIEAIDAYGKQILAASQASQGFLTWAAPPEAYHRSPIGLSNFSFNHTMLVAKLANPALTYLQVSLDAHRFVEQIAMVRANYPHDIAFHIELMRMHGSLIAAGLPLFAYRGPDVLADLMATIDGTGARVINPHTYLLDLDHAHSKTREEKATADPLGLLNPGKIEETAPLAQALDLA